MATLNTATVTTPDTEAKASELCCVIWRKGGTLNFKWHRTVSESYDKALETLADIARMGYVAHIVNSAKLEAVGLPTQYLVRLRVYDAD